MPKATLKARARSPKKVSGKTLTHPLAKAKVLIVHHACWIRRAMRNLIDQTERFTVCAETDNERSAIALFEQQRPKIVVLNLVLTHGRGLNLIKSLIKLAPATLILVLSCDEGVMSIAGRYELARVGYLTVEDGDLELPIALERLLVERITSANAYGTSC